jgi:hypothetical protein
MVWKWDLARELNWAIGLSGRSLRADRSGQWRQVEAGRWMCMVEHGQEGFGMVGVDSGGDALDVIERAAA